MYVCMDYNSKKKKRINQLAMRFHPELECMIPNYRPKMAYRKTEIIFAGSVLHCVETILQISTPIGKTK